MDDRIVSNKISYQGKIYQMLIYRDKKGGNLKEISSCGKELFVFKIIENKVDFSPCYFKLDKSIRAIADKLFKSLEKKLVE